MPNSRGPTGPTTNAASGLTTEQVERLKSEFAIYAVGTGRICVAALNQRNLPFVTQAIDQVL